MISFFKDKYTHKISIVAIFYNVNQYTKECLESMLTQDISKEIICVDDGSTDATYKILNEYEQKYDEIKVYRNNENLGGAVARYIGMLHSKGEYILFVDGDDALIPNSLDILYKKAIEEKTDILEFSIETDGSQQMFNGSLKRTNTRIDSNILEAYDEKKILNTLANKLISKKVYKKVIKKINPQTRHANYSAVIYFLYQFLVYAQNVVTTETVGYFYYDKRGMTATMNWLERYQQFCSFDVTYRELLETYGYSKTLKNIYNIVCNQAIGAFLNMTEEEQKQNKGLVLKLMTEEEADFLINKHIELKNNSN